MILIDLFNYGRCANIQVSRDSSSERIKQRLQGFIVAWSLRVAGEDYIGIFGHAVNVTTFAWKVIVLGGADVDVALSESPACRYICTGEDA